MLNIKALEDHNLIEISDDMNKFFMIPTGEYVGPGGLTRLVKHLEGLPAHELIEAIFSLDDDLEDMNVSYTDFNDPSAGIEVSTTTEGSGPFCIYDLTLEIDDDSETLRVMIPVSGKSEIASHLMIDIAVDHLTVALYSTKIHPDLELVDLMEFLSTTDNALDIIQRVLNSSYRSKPNFSIWLEHDGLVSRGHVFSKVIEHDAAHLFSSGQALVAKDYECHAELANVQDWMHQNIDFFSSTDTLRSSLICSDLGL